MNEKELARKIINAIYGILTLIIIVAAAVALYWVVLIVTLPQDPNEVGFNFAWAIPFLLGVGLSIASIPMGIVSIGAWKLNNIKEHSNRRILTILLFLPTIICLVFLFVSMIDLLANNFFW